MKKILFATSALVGAAAFTAPAMAEGNISTGGTLKIGAWINAVGSVASQSDRVDRQNNGHIQSDSEISFKWSRDTDIGVVEYHVEMETGDTGSGIDENHLAISSNWGKVTLGNQDGAADMYGVNATYIGAKLGQSMNPTGSDLTNIRKAYAGASTGVDLSGDTSDQAKITYETPSFGGFTIAASYSAGGDYNGHTSLGGRFKRDMGAVSLDVGASFAQSDFSGTVGTRTTSLTDVNNPNGTVGTDVLAAIDALNVTSGGTTNRYLVSGAGRSGDYDGFMAGFVVGFGGFKVGAGYMTQEWENTYDLDVFVNQSHNYKASLEEDSWNVGVGYAVGKFSINTIYQVTESDYQVTSRRNLGPVATPLLQRTNTVNDEKVKEISLGLGYNVAEGLSVSTAFLKGEINNGGAEGGVTPRDNDYDVVTVTVRAAF